MKTTKTLHLLFFGPQGSGKGTQAAMLADKLKMRHLSSGDVLRAIAKTKSPLGKYLKRQLNIGTLTPINKLMEVFDMYMKRVPKSQGIIFDGFARQITEAKIFLRRLRLMGRGIDAVVLITVSKKETLKRLSKRGTCDACKRVFILSAKLKVGSKCPNCRGTIMQRLDDKPAAIEKRLRIYNKRTLPAVRYFSKQGLLVRIDGEQSIQRVHQDIVRSLRRKSFIR